MSEALSPLDSQLASLKRQESELLIRKRDLIEADVLSLSLEDYVKEAWPTVERGRDLKWNWHIGYICEYLEAVSDREITRLVINIPPRCMKSLNVSVFHPTWTWTKDPAHQFLTLSNAEKLAIRDAVKSRRLLQSRWYQDRWSSRFRLSTDQNAKSRYENDHGGHRIAFGFGASIIGEGGDTIIIDDPHDVTGAQSEAERNTTLEIFDEEIFGRMNDQAAGGSAIIVIMQRLHEQDLSGHVLAEEGEFEHLCLPMEYDGVKYHSVIGLDDPRQEKGQLLWPERFPQQAINTWKRRLGPYAASGQLQQAPSPGEGGILKRAWWRDWPMGKPLPQWEYVLQVYDTAFETREESDFSARTTWGLFRLDETTMRVGEGRWNAMIIERWADRVGFPDLKLQARMAAMEWDPDFILIEPKASGKSLIQELVQMGIPAQEWTPTRSQGNSNREVDKVSRAHLASSVLAGGQVWYPRWGSNKNELEWPQEVIDNCANFPKTDHDDIVDTVTIALMFLRRMWIDLPEDPDEDDEDTIDSRDVEPAYG